MCSRNRFYDAHSHRQARHRTITSHKNQNEKTGAIVERLVCIPSQRHRMVHGPHVESDEDASYLSVVKGRFRAAGYFFLTNKPATPKGPYKPNGAVHILCHIMREVLSSVAEAQLGALFHNGKEACPLRIALQEMGHPQPATPMS